jgi:hypothetical protein
VLKDVRINDVSIKDLASKKIKKTIQKEKSVPLKYENQQHYKMSQDTKIKLAVLIDADNVQYSNVKGMMEIANLVHQPQTVCRWTKPNT